MKKSNLIKVLILLGMIVKSSICLVAQTTNGEIHKKSRGSLLRYQFNETFAPIEADDLAHFQRIHYFEELAFPLASHSIYNLNDIELDIAAIDNLILKYTNNTNVTHFEIRLCEITNAAISFPYFNNNSGKIHLVFYAYDSLNNYKIDQVPYDVTIGVVNSTTHLPIEHDIDFVNNMALNYSLNTLPILEAVKPNFDGAEIKGVSNILINISHLKKTIDEDPFFDAFKIYFGLVRKSDANYYPGNEAVKYEHFEKMDGIFNLLFLKNYPINTPEDKIDTDYYDLNDACPPGNCH